MPRNSKNSKHAIIKHIEMPKIFPAVSDGKAEPGHAMLTGPNEGQRDWNWLFSSTESLDNYWPGAKTPFEVAQESGGMHLHNPGGIFRPMALDQFQQTTALSLWGPQTDRLAATVDWRQFRNAASRYKRRTNLWLSMYVGGMEISMPALYRETPTEYADRVINYLAPILTISPRIDALGFDHLLGVPYDATNPQYRVVGGPNGASAIVIKRIQDMGITVVVEPTYFEDADWFSTVSTLATDRFINSKENRGWHVNDHHGVRQDIVPLLETEGTPWVFDRLSWTLTDERKWARIWSWNNKGYSVGYPLSRFPRIPNPYTITGP